MAVDFSRILTVLNTAGIQRSDPAIYQAINSLIQYAKESQALLESAISANAAEIAAISGGGGTGASGFRWSWTSVTDAEFKTLPSTYITVVESPGANNVLIPLWAYIRVETVTPYTNVDVGSQAGLTITYGDWSSEAFNFNPSYWTGGTTHFCLQPIHQVPNAQAILFPPPVPGLSGYPDHSALSALSTEPLKLVAWNDSGDYTGGDAANYVKVGVAYLILNINTGLFV